MHKSLEPDLGRMIAYCGHLGRQSTDQMLRRAGYDVTPVQTQALMYLACRQRNRETSQRDLERELHLKASTVNGIVGRLEEKGYISRRTSPYDGRIRLVGLTELPFVSMIGAAASKVEDFRAALEETERRFTAGLTDRERETLGALLERIIANLENEVSNP